MSEAIERIGRSHGARLVSVEGRELPLKSVTVSGQAKGGLARVLLKQSFANPHDQPLKVIYGMPLPADGAVAAYEFRIGARRVVGEIDRRAAARDRFEKALIEGRTAGILDEERANLFTQEIGNVPPRTEVEVEVSIDQPLVWLPEGMWEWRFPTVATPRYLGAPGRVEDASMVTVDVADRPMGARATFELVIGDPLADGRRPESPSHKLSIDGRGTATRAALADEKGVALDRDLVVRWAVPRPRTGVSLQTARPEAGRTHAGHAYGLLTIVPPQTPAAVYPRDLIVLLDTSGSMTGQPLDQARRVVAALVDSLTDVDRLEMISFSDSPRRWRSQPLPAGAETRREAHRWLAALTAGGGTEMLRALAAALEPLRADAQRQVVLVTDGQIGFESEILRTLKRDLPRGARLHAAGVGPSPNRALTRPAARAGRGVEVLAALDEDAERAAARLIAATRGPAIVDLEIDGAAVIGYAPRPLPDLMAGAPVLVGLSLRPDGGQLVVRGRAPDGRWEERLEVPATGTGAGRPGVTALYGRESVENFELDLAAGGDRDEIERAIERVGLEFSLATPLTSWVAISEEPGVDPRLPVRREIIPQELPYGLSAEGLGLLASQGGMAQEVAFHLSGLLGSMGRDSAETPPRRSQLPAGSRMRGLTRFGYIRPRRHEPGDIQTGSARATATTIIASGRWIGPVPEGWHVLEFRVTGGSLDWRPPRLATLDLRNRQQIKAPVVPSATTLPGLIEPGYLVRLALQIDAAVVQGVERIYLMFDNDILMIRV
jgi:Ca-activated chloride channel family protein